MRTDGPFFSVIIPSYNRAERLRRTIESIRLQSFQDLEVIVCDDGSSDHTREVATSFQNHLNITYIREDHWGGPARPRNNGARAAHGEWLCFLDADDWWYPDKLQRVYATISPADVIHHDSDIYISSNKRSPFKMRSRTLHPPVFVDMMTRGNPIITSGVCVRKGIFDQTYGFPEDKSLISVEDFDLWLRISMITDRFVHIPLSLGGYWKGDGNISVSPQHISAHVALFDKFRDHLPPEARVESERYFSYCIGLAMLSNGRYGRSREQFLRSLRSRDVSLAAKSLFRIMTSAFRQLTWNPERRN